MLKTVSPFNTASPTFSGDVTLSTGNLVIGTNGKGIDFSASSHAAGMTSELLDDYEVGTFTPTLEAATTDFTSVTYSNQYGFYTKVGNLVHIDIYLQTSGTTGGSGTLQIGGLPFAALGSSDYNNTGNCIGYGITFAGTLLESYVPQGTSVIQFLTQASGGAYAALNSTDWGGGVKVMKVSLTYRAN